MCEIGITRVRGASTGTWADSVTVSGTASGCERVQVRVECGAPQETEVEVVAGRFEATFDARVECACGGDVEVVAVCADDPQCRAVWRGTLKCDDEGGRDPGEPRALDLEHFLVYRLAGAKRRKVWLQGQFDERPMETEVGRMVRLANPVNKQHGRDEQGAPLVSRIGDDRNHLTWYRVERRVPDSPRRVFVENQFGRAEWTIGEPRFLLVPAQKQGHEPPERLEHFLCYEVLRALPVEESVELWDQFIEERTGFRVGMPRLLGVPVTKSHEPADQLDAPRNSEAHLAVYRVGRHPHRQSVWVDDQFHDERQKVTSDEAILLCVPSTKELIKA